VLVSYRRDQLRAPTHSVVNISVSQVLSADIFAESMASAVVRLLVVQALPHCHENSTAPLKTVFKVNIESVASALSHQVLRRVWTTRKAVRG
jgi:hypothetical protein